MFSYEITRVLIIGPSQPEEMPLFYLFIFWGGGVATTFTHDLRMMFYSMVTHAYSGKRIPVVSTASTELQETRGN